MNALTNTATAGSTAVATTEKNVFEQYGEAASQNRLVGKMLKFSKGDYLLGQGNDMVEAGTEVACNMEELLIGWVKWQDNKPVDHIMGKLSEGFVPPKRDTLGDLDKANWEIDEQSNQPKDPWQLTNYLIMKMPGIDSEEALMTFVTSSTGGRGAIGELCKTFGKQQRMRGSKELPIVKLDVGKYKHSNPQFGWIKYPVFKMTGWVAPHEFDVAMAEAAEQAEADAAAKKQQEEIPF